MNKFTRIAAGVALATVAAASQAGVVLTTPSLTGFASVSGFADATPNTFSAVYRDLEGTVTGSTLADGEYTVSVQGGVSFTGFAGPGGTVAGTLNSPFAIFTGLIDTTNLPLLKNESFTFKPGAAGANDVRLGSHAFSIAYDGETSTELMKALAAMTGFGFSDPTGSGTLNVVATLFSDGARLDFTETNLNWTGFGNILAAADYAFGGRNGVIDGNFALTNVTVSAVPEPASLALVGLALVGAAAASRRRKG